MMTGNRPKSENPEEGTSLSPRDSRNSPQTADEMFDEELRKQHAKTESQLSEAAEQYDENRVLRVSAYRWNQECKHLNLMRLVAFNGL